MNLRALLAAAFGVCWPLAVAASDAVSVQWRTAVASSGTAYKPREAASPLLSSDGRTVWVGTAAGVSAVDTASGRVLWQAATTDPVAGRPVAVQLPGESSATLYAATMAGAVHAWHAQSGAPRWAQPSRLDVPVRSPLTADNRYVYVVADPGSVQALDPLTGRPVWRWSTVVDREYLIEGQGGALARDGVVYSGTPTGKLVALSARDGALLWETTLEQPQRSPYGDVDSTPVWSQGPGGQAMVLAASHSGGLCAVAPQDGRVLWRYDAEALGQPLLTSGGIVSVAALGTLHVIDLRGQPKLVRKLPGPTAGVAAWLGADLLAVPTETGMLLVRWRDGVTLRHIDAELGFAAAPLQAGGLTLALANSGDLWGLHIWPQPPQAPDALH